MNQETIWDYKPTEEEIKKIFDFFEINSEKKLKELVKTSERDRFASLYLLFDNRKDSKNLKRIDELWDKYQHKHQVRDHEF